MRVRILHTDGTATVDLFWVSHDGKDVYYGSVGESFKRSYHASGKIHTTHANGEKTEHVWHVPLQQISGQHHLTTISWVKGDLPLAGQINQYSGRKSDAVLMVDSRSIRKGQHVGVAVGLLENGNTAIVGRMIEGQAIFGIETKQVLIATGVTPWVYAMLSWSPPDLYERLDALPRQ